MPLPIDRRLNLVGMETGVRWRRALPAMGGVALAVALVALTISYVDAPTLRAWVRDAGPAAPIVFVGLYVLASVMLVPRSMLNVTAGVLFPAPLAIALALLAVLPAALVPFLISRRLGRAAVEDRLARGPVGRADLARYDAMLRRRGIWAVIAMRLVPAVPFGVVNWLAGLTALRPAQFALGTAIGAVPSTTLVVLGTTGLVTWLG